MSITNEVDAIIQKRNSRVHVLAEREEHMREIRANLELLEEQQKRMFNNRDKLRLDNEVLNCIQELDIKQYKWKWNELQKAFGELQKRFARETINIAVIGEARQGKSRFLQSVSGLDDRVIPAFVTSDCTGTTSMIKNVAGQSLCAEITFRTEREMIQNVQAYLDDMLGKGARRIESFYEIKQIDLAEIRREIEGSPEMARFEHFEKYVKYFEEWSPYVQAGKVVSITNPEEIKTFVAQHNGKKETDSERENYYKYLAVKQAVISCEFNYKDAGKIVLQDTIGLGDTSLGIETAMLETVAQNSDAAIIVKRPEIGSGKFDNKDFELYKKLNTAFKEKNMGKWLFWLTNQTTGEPYGNNYDRCLAVEEKIKKLNWELAGHAIVNVADTEQVNNEFLHMVLSTLVANIDSIDAGLVENLNKLSEELYYEYEGLQEKVQKILVNELKHSVNIFEFVNNKWDDFYKHTFMRKMKKYRNDWKEKSKEECTEYKNYIENILDNARRNIPDVQELEWELGAGGDHGAIDVYEYHIDKLRTEFTEKFLDIDECILDEMMKNVKEEIVDIFANDDGGRLKYVKPIDQSKPKIEWLSYAADDIFTKESQVHLRKAFHILDKFELTVRGFLMHKVRERVRRLEIENGKKFDELKEGSLHEQAEKIKRFLDKNMKDVCEELRDELEELYREPGEIIYAIVQEFYDRICFSTVSGKRVAENAWRNLYCDNCAYVWSEEFKDSKFMSEIYDDWDKLRNQLAKYSKEDFTIQIN